MYPKKTAWCVSTFATDQQGVLESHQIAAQPPNKREVRRYRLLRVLHVGMRVSAVLSSMLYNLLFKAIFGQDYPNLGRLCNMLVLRPGSCDKRTYCNRLSHMREFVKNGSS